MCNNYCHRILKQQSAATKLIDTSMIYRVGQIK